MSNANNRSNKDQEKVTTDAEKIETIKKINIENVKKVIDKLFEFDGLYVYDENEGAKRVELSERTSLITQAPLVFLFFESFTKFNIEINSLNRCEDKIERWKNFVLNILNFAKIDYIITDLFDLSEIEQCEALGIPYYLFENNIVLFFYFGVYVTFDEWKNKDKWSEEKPVEIPFLPAGIVLNSDDIKNYFKYLRRKIS